MEKVLYDINALREILPQRYPFLMLDKIIELEDNHRIVSIKNVTVNEPFFQGHFPEKPIMPGVMILEAMAQTGAVMAKVASNGTGMNKNLFFAGADKVRWKRPVIPGDTLRIEMIFTKRHGPMWVMDGKVTVEGKLVTVGTLLAMETEEIG